MKNLINNERPLAVIIDDDESFNSIMSRVLEQRGYKVKAYKSEVDFFSAPNFVHPSVIFVDLNIHNEKDGLSLIKSMRNWYQIKSPIFVVSGTYQHEIIETAIQYGATDYFIKPIHLHVFNNKFSNYMNKSNQEMSQDHLLPSSFLGERLTIGVDFQVLKIDEGGILFSGKHVLQKGTVLSIKGDIFNELIGLDQSLKIVINKTEFSSSLKQYIYYGVFEEVSVEFLMLLRRWILLHI